MSLLETYNHYLYERADPRTLNWTFNGSPVPLLLLTIAYLLYTLKFGPAYMKNRPAYSLLTYSRFYDIAQIIANSWFVYYSLKSGWLTEDGVICKRQTYLYTPMHIMTLNVSWWVMLLKIIDYSETVVFVLRKKHKQVSFLHVYHHVSTVWLAWIVLRYYCVPMIQFFVIINCGVHVIMYSYYFIATFGPQVQVYLHTVKPLITIVQMVQFCVLLLYGVNIFFPDCYEMTPMALVMTSNLLINFYLFYDFYKKSYKKPKQK